jgi:hypothetical protein
MEGGKWYTQLSSLGQSMVWLIIISVLVLQGGLKKSLLVKQILFP